MDPALPVKDRFNFEQLIASKVQDPKSEIQGLIARGKELHDRSLQLKEASRDIDGKVVAGVNILDALFDLSGHKRASKRVGKWWLHGNIAQQRQALDQEYERWCDDCRNALGQMSVYRKGVTLRGDARTLQSRYSKTRQYVRTETRLHHGVSFLESLLELELVYNDGLSDYFPGAENVQRMLQSYPEEGEAISGAIAVYENKGPDANRQALASCRNGLEKLVCQLSEEGDWKKGLPKLTKSRMKQRYIKDTYGYLSAYGSHGPRPPSDVDTELGIEMTLAAMKWLLVRRQDS
jgi:hypothetical protein